MADHGFRVPSGSNSIPSELKRIGSGHSFTRHILCVPFSIREETVLLGFRDLSLIPASPAVIENVDSFAFVGVAAQAVA